MWTVIGLPATASSDVEFCHRSKVSYQFRTRLQKLKWLGLVRGEILMWQICIHLKVNVVVDVWYALFIKRFRYLADVFSIYLVVQLVSSDPRYRAEAV